MSSEILAQENIKKTIRETQTVRLICFYLGDQIFGLPIHYVKEVIVPSYITPLVHTPQVIQGVINLRGNIIMIVNIKEVFEIEDSDNKQGGNRIVIVDNKGKISGFIVDRMEVSLEVNADQIVKPKDIGLEETLSYCFGTVELDHQSLTIIDVESLHEMPEILDLG